MCIYIYCILANKNNVEIVSILYLNKQYCIEYVLLKISTFLLGQPNYIIVFYTEFKKIRQVKRDMFWPEIIR